jgi:hypothetical protein
VTARAVWIYDPRLCGALVDALSRQMKAEADREANEEAQAQYEDLWGEDATDLVK